MLHPYASHWHARQARSGEAQSRGPAGQMRILAYRQDLLRRGYEGVICLEYVHGAWLQQDRVDCLTETVAPRDELDRYLRGGTG